MKSIADRALDEAILHGMVIGTWAAFRLVKLRSRRFRNAVDSFEATYQFRTASAGRTLIFSGGRITTRRGFSPSPDYEIVLLDPRGAFRQLFKNPDDMIRLLMENKIDQRGNNYYLFKYGYLLGLCERFLRESIEKYTPSSIMRRIRDEG